MMLLTADLPLGLVQHKQVEAQQAAISRTAREIHGQLCFGLAREVARAVVVAEHELVVQPDLARALSPSKVVQSQGWPQIQG